MSRQKIPCLPYSILCVYKVPRYVGVLVICQAPQLLEVGLIVTAEPIRAIPT